MIKRVVFLVQNMPSTALSETGMLFLEYWCSDVLQCIMFSLNKLCMLRTVVNALCWHFCYWTVMEM